MSFSDIRDQETAVRFLGNMLSLDRIPNAVLLWGPPGVGKRLASDQIAKAINCPERKNDSCGECLTCRKIEHGNHPDLHTVAPIKKSRNIDVEAINELIELASLRPFESKWRIFIIHEADRMRPPAQNHLLKTLEEPLGQSLFILISEHPKRLLPTIRSRCQQIRFGALKPRTVVELLRRDHEVSKEAAVAIAAIAQGQMSRAVDLLESGKRAVVFDVIKRLAEGENPLQLAEEFAKHLANQKAELQATLEAESGPEDIRDLSKEDREQMKDEQIALVDAVSRRDILEHLYLMETWYRDKLVYNATSDASRLLNGDQLAFLESAEIDGPDEKIGAIEKSRLYLERFLNEERVFRDLFFALAK